MSFVLGAFLWREDKEPDTKLLPLKPLPSELWRFGSDSLSVYTFIKMVAFMRKLMSVGTFVALIVLLITQTANAYTLVLRDGRRVEIPDHFFVGTSTLTYEAGAAI